MRSTFFHSLKRNQDMLAESLNLDQNDDIVTRSFTALGRSCALYFVEGMASGQRMSDSVLRPLLRAQEELSGRQALEAADLAALAALDPEEPARGLRLAGAGAGLDLWNRELEGCLKTAAALHIPGKLRCE